jgi:hypothetical protein
VFLIVVLATDWKEFATIESVVEVQDDCEFKYTIALYFLDVDCAPTPIATLPELAAITVEQTVLPVVASGSQETPGYLQLEVLLTYAEEYIVTRVLKYNVASGSLPLAGMQAYSDNELYMTSTVLLNGEVGLVCCLTYWIEPVLLVLIVAAMAVPPAPKTEPAALVLM